jgi:hypothetical protein
MRANKATEKVTNATTETELTGIRIAAINGDKLAVTAKERPMTL